MLSKSAIKQSLLTGYKGEPTSTAAGGRVGIVPPPLIETFNVFNTATDRISCLVS